VIQQREAEIAVKSPSPASLFSHFILFLLMLFVVFFQLLTNDPNRRSIDPVGAIVVLLFVACRTLLYQKGLLNFSSVINWLSVKVFKKAINASFS
jgi:hypothetical protein